jgi:hypothetical protein
MQQDEASFEMSPAEMLRLNQYQPTNVSQYLEPQPSDQVNMKVNELRLQRTLQAQPFADFASKFETSQGMLDDMNFDDMNLSDESMNATVVDAPPLQAQNAADFAARFQNDDEFLDDIALNDSSFSFSTPQERLIDVSPAPPRRPNTSLPQRYQKVPEGKLLDLDF